MMYNFSESSTIQILAFLYVVQWYKLIYFQNGSSFKRQKNMRKKRKQKNSRAML